MSAISGIFIPQDVIDLILLKLYNQTSTLINKRSRNNYFRKYGIYILIKYENISRKYITYHIDEWNNPNKYPIDIKIKGVFDLDLLKDIFLRLSPSTIKFRCITVFDYFYLTTHLAHTELKGAVYVCASHIDEQIGKMHNSQLVDKDVLLMEMISNMQTHSGLAIRLATKPTDCSVIKRPCISSFCGNETSSLENALMSEIIRGDFPKGGEYPNVEKLEILNYSGHITFENPPVLPKLKKIKFCFIPVSMIDKIVEAYPTIEKIRVKYFTYFEPCKYIKLKTLGLVYRIEDSTSLDQIINLERTNPRYNNSISFGEDIFNIAKIMTAAKYFRVYVNFEQISVVLRFVEKIIRYKSFKRFREPRRLIIWTNYHGNKVQIISFKEMIDLFREKNIFLDFKIEDQMDNLTQKIEILRIRRSFRELRHDKIEMY